MKTFLSILISLFITLELQSQQYNFKTYTMDDGLPNSTILSIFQDSQGYLWVGTDGGGVSRFDGTVFHNFDTKEGLADNVVRCITEDSKGNLWFGTDKGVSVYNGYKFKTINVKSGLTSNTIKVIFEDSKHNIWVGTTDGGLNRLIKLKNDSIGVGLKITSNEGLKTDFIFDIYEDKNNRLWLAMPGSIHIITFNKEGYKIERLNDYFILPSDIITSIEEDVKGNLWFSTYDAGVFKINTLGKDSGRVTKVYDINNGLGDNQVWDILSDKRGRLWFATNGSGLNRLADSKIKIFTEENGIPNFQVLCLYEDSEGNIWFGSGSGLSKFMGDQFVHYTIKDGFPSDKIAGIVQDKNSNFWFASYDAGLLKATFKGDKPVVTKYTTDNGLPDNNLRALSLSVDDYPWIATQAGISKYNGRGFINFTKEDGIGVTKGANSEGGSDETSSILIDTKGAVWCGTKGGISKYDGARIITMNEDNGLPDNEIQTIILDKHGYLWFAMLEGLGKYLLGDTTMYTFDEKDGLYDNKIHALTEDYSGNVWIGTFGGGLYKYDYRSTSKKPIQLVADDNVLSSNNIYSLAFQDRNTLIVGTNRGFDKVIFDKSHKIVYVKNYNKTDGFMGLENLYNSIYKDNKGNIWMGTQKMLTKYIPEEDFINTTEPRTHITRVKLIGKYTDLSLYSDTMDWKKNLPVNLKLPYNVNSLSFDFLAIHFKNQEKVVMQYKLEGFDKEWSEISNKTDATYTNLKPGKYVFKVKARNCDGIWNKKPTEFSFVIKKPFWKTWWYYASEIGFFLLLVSISFYLNRTQKASRIGTIFTFVFIILICEFINVTIEPYVEKFSSGVPLFKLIINIGLAISLSPIEKLIAKLDKYI